MVPALFVVKETVSKYACDTAVPLNPLFIRQQLHQGQEQGYIVCVTHAAVFWNQSTCLTLAAVFWNRSTFERIRLKNLRQINRIRILPTLDRILLKKPDPNPAHQHGDPTIYNNISPEQKCFKHRFKSPGHLESGPQGVLYYSMYVILYV